MPSFQASSTIEYLALHNISRVVLMNMIACMNLFATSKVAFLSSGAFWSALALGCGRFWTPLVLGSSSAWVDGARSELDTLLRRVDIWHLSSGGAIAPAGLQGFESWGHAITVSVQVYIFGSETFLIHPDLSWHIWSRSRMSCWCSKSSSSMIDDKVDSPWCALWSALISGAVSLSCYNDDIGEISHP